ncbi:MAG: L-threonylcarbamoyladenylate synthase [Anaerolineae bacterium]|jgi:L-threonylcarbamoyladenylate synthase
MKMRTEVIDVAGVGARQRALDVLRSGRLVAFPTDTVYGLAADPWNEDAVKQLYQVKERPKELPIPLLLCDATELDQVAILPKRCRALPGHFWPGGLTLVLPKKAVVSESITNKPTVAVRVPGLPLARAIIRRAGGVLAVTSANASGGPSPVTAQDVEEQLGGRIALILDGGPCRAGIPSTILDCSISPPRILRHGVIGEEELYALLYR